MELGYIINLFILTDWYIFACTLKFFSFEFTESETATIRSIKTSNDTFGAFDAKQRIGGSAIG